MSSLRCPLPASACLDFPSPVSRPRLCRKTSGSAAVARFAPCPSGLPVLPLRYALAAFRPDVHIWPSRSVPSVPPCQRTHTWTNPRSFAFPLVEGSTSFLVTVEQERAGRHVFDLAKVVAPVPDPAQLARELIPAPIRMGCQQAPHLREL